MEYFSVNGLIIIISVCVIAFFIGRLTSKERKDKKRLEAELEESREELKNYRTKVSSHFQETAQKVNALTENYRSVYEHLARGAQSLCDKNDTPVLMNELNRNPMLADETIENSKVDHETAPTKVNADNNSDSNSELEVGDKNPDNTTDTTASGDQAKSNDNEADQNSNTVESSEMSENAGESTDSDAPIIAADEHIKPEQQAPR